MSESKASNVVETPSLESPSLESKIQDALRTVYDPEILSYWVG